MQTQTRRLQSVALLATRQEAEFVSGVLDAADLPHAIVESAGRFELRVDADDADKVRELIERLDVKRLAAEGTAQRTAEAAGRRLLLLIVGVLVGGLGVLVAVGAIPMPRAISGVSLGLLLAITGAALVVVAAIRRKK